MLRVPIYMIARSPDKPTGYITWDGQELHVQPDDVPALQAVLYTPVATPHGVLDPHDDPEAWLKALPDYFGGSYMNAGAVEEI